MAIEKKQAIRQIILLLPLILFLVVSFSAWKRAQTGAWHPQITQFWEKQQWQQIISLSENLWKAGKVDPEALHAAMLASLETNDVESAGKFSERLVQQDILNRRIEKNVRSIYPRTSIASLIQVYRTDIVLLLFLFLSVLCLASVKKRQLIPWITIFSLAGLSLFFI